MLIDAFHLTYCTNIHAAEGWDAVFANLKRYAPGLKARFSRDAPFGIGLRLSAREARELLETDRLEAFQEFLAREGLYVAIVNGFPYGPFHGTPVKANVYAPDWRDPARVEYTVDLIRILAKLLPDGLDGGISTAPLSYKQWMSARDEAGWHTITQNVVRVVEGLARARDETGAQIHLDIEPEPDCSIENSDESISYFERWLDPVGAPALASGLGITTDRARDLLFDHVRLCFDCCHFAVEFEDPAEALERLRKAGIKIGRVQLSSALRVLFATDSSSVTAARKALERFADTTYLHQVVARTGETLCQYPDLGPALHSAPTTPADEWRIHFHVPLFAREYEAFGSTQDYVRRVLELARSLRFTRHLEIETYTWEVLPAGLKVDLAESIAREYDWVLGALAAPRA